MSSNPIIDLRIDETLLLRYRDDGASPVLDRPEGIARLPLRAHRCPEIERADRRSAYGKRRRALRLARNAQRSTLGRTAWILLLILASKAR